MISTQCCDEMYYCPVRNELDCAVHPQGDDCVEHAGLHVPLVEMSMQDMGRFYSDSAHRDPAGETPRRRGPRTTPTDAAMRYSPESCQAIHRWLDIDHSSHDCGRSPIPVQTPDGFAAAQPGDWVIADQLGQVWVAVQACAPAREDAGNITLIDAIDTALLANSFRLRELHHSYPRLDANARHLIAEVAAGVVAELQAAADGDRSEVAYFGDGWVGPGRKVPTPAGARCLDCHTRVAMGDQGYIVLSGLVPGVTHRNHAISISAGRPEQ